MGDVAFSISADDQASPAILAAQQALRGLGMAAGAVTAATGFVAVALRNAINQADELNDASQRLGMSVQQLVAYRLAAEQSGASLDAVGRGVKSLSAVMQKHGDVLRQAGIDTLDADKALMGLADVFASMPDGMEKSALAVKLFGREGVALIPMLNQGSAALAEAEQKSRIYGESMAKLAPAADRFNDILKESQFAAGNWARIVAAEAMPAINDLAGTLLDINNSAGGLTGGLKALANDGSLKRWADDAATTLAGVVDWFGKINTYAEVANIRLLQAQTIIGQGARVLAMGANPVAIVLNRNEIAKTVSDISTYLDSSNKEISEKMASLGGNGIAEALKNKQGDPWREWTDRNKEYAIRAAEVLTAYAAYPLEVQRKAMQALTNATYNNGVGGSLLRTLGGKDKSGGVDQGAAALESLELRLIGVNEQFSEFDKVVEKVTKGAWKGFGDVTKANLLAVAGEIDEMREEKKVWAEFDRATSEYLKHRADLEKEMRQQMSAAMGAEYQRVTSMQAQNQALRDEMETMGMSARQIAEYNAAKLEAAANSDYEFADAVEKAAREIRGEGEEAVAARKHYLDLAEAKRMLAAAGMDQAALVRQSSAQRAALDEQKAIWNGIEQTAHQTFISIFDSGKDAFDRLRDTLKNGLYELLYQMTLKRWMIQLAVSTSGEGTASSVFGQGAVNAVMSGGSSLSGLSNLASLWNGYGNTMGPPVEGSLADYASYLNGMPIGGILSAYSVGGVKGFATGVGSTALAGGVGGLASGAGFMSGATGALASMGPYGWAALAAAAILGMNQGGGTPHVGGTAYSAGDGYQTPRGASAINAYYADPTADNKMALSDWTKRWSQATADALGPAAESFAKTFNKIVMANGAAGGYTVGLGFSADGDDPVRARSTILDALGRQVAWTKDFNKLGSDPQKGLELMLTEQVPKLMLTALRDVDLGKTLNDFFDSSITSAGDLLQTLTKEQTSAMLELMSSGTLDDIIDRMHLTRMSFANVATSVTDFLPAMQQAEQAFQAVKAQIADIRAASSQMFADSARSIRLDVLDNQGKYDFFKQEVERYRDVMMSLTDATLIQDYAAKINQTLMASWGVLDDTQKQASVDKYEKLFAEADQLTSDRLAQAEQVAADERLKWAESVGTAINQAMDRAAAKIAAAVPQRIEVGVNVTGSVAASSEVVAY